MIALMPADYFQKLLESGKVEIEIEYLSKCPVKCPVVDRITLSFKSGLKAVLLWGFHEIIATLWEPSVGWAPIEFEFPSGSGNTYIEYRLTGKEEVIEFVEYCLNTLPEGQQEKIPPKPQQKIPPITPEDIQALRNSYQ